MVGYVESVVEISNEHERLVDKQKRNIKGGLSNNREFIYHQENH